MRHELNQKQDRIVTRLLGFDVDNCMELGIEGPPGTGKTYLLDNYASRSNKNILFTAPTNKAVKVMRRVIGENHYPNVDFATTYSALSLKMDKSGEYKKVVRTADSDKLEGVDVMVIDERSMENESLRDWVKRITGQLGIKVIYVGDRWQLPPVGETIARNFVEVEENIELTELDIVRQAKDNPIIKLILRVRRCCEDGEWPEIFTEGTSAGGVYVMEYGPWLDYMRKGFASRTYRDIEDSYKVLAWRNDVVDNYNRQIRRAIYGPEQAAAWPFVQGERVTAGTQLDSVQGALYAGRMTTDEEAVVHEVSVGWHPSFQEGEYKVWDLTLQAENGLFSALACHDESRNKLNERLDAMRDEAKKNHRLWKLFWDFHELFHDIRPCHAGTIHKGQGSTYQNVFADVRDVRLNYDYKNEAEALRMLYVQVSRAAKNLLVWK